MSTVSKAGPSRIPTFGSRISQNHTNAKFPEITSKQIGRKVRVGEKEGILRFVGTVHFSKGVWCGIELSSAVGKNDGIVNGVRYFACADRRGLMAPQSKVLLINESCESLNDGLSGPYSMLFIEPKYADTAFVHENKNISKPNTDQIDVKRTLCVNARANFNDTITISEKVANETFNSNQNDYLDNCTREILDKNNSLNSAEDLDRTVNNKHENETYNVYQQRAFNLKITQELNETIIKEAANNCTFEKGVKPHTVNNKQGNETYNACQQRAFNLNFPQELNETIIKGAANDCTFEKGVKHTVNNKQEDETCNVCQQKAFNLNFPQELNETITKGAANNCTFEKGVKPQTNEAVTTEQNATYNKCRRTYDLKTLADSINSAVNSCNFDVERIKNKIETFETDDNLTYLPINKSCENLLNDSSVEAKRRRTSNPKNHKIDALILKNLPDSVDKPSSLPQLRSSLNFNSPSLTSLALNKFSQSTPARGEFTEDLFRKLQISSVSSFGSSSNKNTSYEDSSKRDSLEFEESLGILTPDQMMIDGTFANMQTRSPSLEYESNVSEFGCKNQESISRKSELPSPRDTSLSILDEKILNCALQSGKDFTLDVPESKENKGSELQSPNLNSITDYSLGIIDEHMISNIALKTDTTMNMELPLDSVDKSKDFTLTRLEQTPSPEELPLDPTPIIIESDPKTEPTKSKTTNSFITSITSITSLDTGYQGDGEMSRPASRGADNSPLTRRPLPRPQPRRPDPMTDSDFYTESDADNHEDNQLRGDRRAQVIDGTLYGVDPQAAADIYVNNRENMDSSGIFTDLETNTRNEEDITPNEVPDVSPSDTSSKTVSENSQSNLHEILEKNSSKNDKADIEKTPQKENPKKRNAPSPGVSSPSSISSPRHGAKDEHTVKKYKMPKRDVESKIKTMMEPNQIQQNEKKTVKKPAGRWDAVMNKISKSEQIKTNLKEVKSKVFTNVNVNIGNMQRQTDIRKQNARLPGKSPSNKNFTVSNPLPVVKMTSPNGRNLLEPDHVIPKRRSPRIQTTPTSSRRLEPRTPMSETRRIRNRTSASSTPKNIGSNVESSIHSSLSDVSAATIPPKKIIGSAKKQRDVVQVTQVLTANKLSPRNQQQQTAAENKKNATLHPSSSNESKTRRTIFPPKEKKQTTTKECGRGTVKGGRTSPSVRPPTQTRAPAKQQVPRVAEALAVLVQHLVFNVEAYQVPSLRRQVEKFRLEAEEIRLSCQQLEETLAEERINQTRAIEEERKRCRNDITELIETHRNQLAQLNSRHAETEQTLRAEKENAQKNISKQYEEQLFSLKKEFDKLRRSREESLDILREENDAIREQIDEKQMEIEKMNHESLKLKKDYESREIALKEHNQKLKLQIAKEKNEFEDRLKGLIEENRRLREENDRLLSYGDDKGIGMQEVQSLRAVLELKQKEVGELRKALAEATQKAEVLVGAEEKARLLNARCEDLQLQLQRKSEYEQALTQENLKLQESIKEETNHKKRLSQHNEELQWKLKQNKEVITKVLEQAEETAFNRSVLSSSFNERHGSSRLNLERTFSFRERTYSNRSNVSVDDPVRSRKSKTSLDFEIEDVSPPTSPKVKGVVEKSDSVSYVLDLDESPDVVASRIVRRSFRNSTPPKNTPTKSPSSKRPRIRNPLSQSASSSAIITTNRSEIDRPRSASVRNGECDNENVFLWAMPVTSTPKMYVEKVDENCESSHSSLKLEDNLDLDEDHDVDIQLPALPSVLDRRNGAQALPSPKHLAGEAMISESNSEDESTSSSQL